MSCNTDLGFYPGSLLKSAHSLAHIFLHFWTCSQQDALWATHVHPVVLLAKLIELKTNKNACILCVVMQENFGEPVTAWSEIMGILGSGVFVSF